MAKVRLSVPAVDDLDRMIVTHSLPVDTRLRVQRSLRILEQFPRIGRQLEGRWAPMRVILGPWRWMLIIYSYEEPGRCRSCRRLPGRAVICCRHRTVRFLLSPPAAVAAFQAGEPGSPRWFVSHGRQTSGGELRLAQALRQEGTHLGGET